MQETEDHLTTHLERHSWQARQEPPGTALHFLGLQRWNSLTPAQGRSVGGGYFIYRTNDKGEVDLGIAVDPGFDYVRNLFRMGFSLRDVDIVVISHAHADHLWDFESMVQLLNELEGKKHIVHQLNVILTLGSYQRLKHIINNPKLRRFINPLVIDIRKEIEPGFFRNLGPDHKNEEEFFNYCFAFAHTENKKKQWQWDLILPDLKANTDVKVLEIWPTRAYHDDHSDISDSFGFIIKFRPKIKSGGTEKEFCFGYTGDTKWVGDDLYHKDSCPRATIDDGCKNKYDHQAHWKDISGQYSDCDVLLMHLGSLIDHKDVKKQKFKNYRNSRDCEDLIRDKNHPYLMGMIRFLGELYNNASKEKLILMGEFGEELRGGIRTDLVKRFQQGIEPWRMLPIDVGLDVLLHDYKGIENNTQNKKYKFLCALCDKHRPLEEIDYLRFGPDEAIFYTCKTCIKATPDDVRQIRL
ncbi:MAG: MBL fold metallo-hydrolase, partial [Acetobacterium sp.]|nr:MBL fold metallo-hydrolase [Acetobacterium sp.]